MLFIFFIPFIMFLVLASRKAAEIVHREMLSLHPLILESLDDIGRSQVRKLLERLQVKCLTSRELIKHHIIPALQASQNTSVRFFLQFLQFIHLIKPRFYSDLYMYVLLMVANDL